MVYARASLKGGNRESVSIGQGGPLMIPEAARWLEGAGRLAHEATPGDAPEADAREDLPQPRRGRVEGDEAHPHVARELDHARDVQLAEITPVAHPVPSDPYAAGRRSDDRIGPHRSGVEGGRDRERLDRGAGLEYVGGGPVAGRGSGALGGIVRIVAGWLTRARTAPVRASMATTEPPSASLRRTAALSAGRRGIEAGGRS